MKLPQTRTFFPIFLAALKNNKFHQGKYQSQMIILSKFVSWISCSTYSIYECVLEANNMQEEGKNMIEL